MSTSRTPRTPRTSRAIRLRRGLAVRAASTLQRLTDPSLVFRLTGVMPRVEAPDPPRVLRVLPEPPPFDSPDPVRPDDDRTWSRSLRRDRLMAHLLEVENGIALPSGAVFDQRGRFLPTASHDHDFLDRRERQSRGFVPEPHRPFPNVRHVQGHVVVASTSSQGFYFHWIFDVLPRIHLAEQAGFETAPLYIDVSLPFQRESLGLIRRDGGERIFAVGGGAITGEKLIVPCHHVMPGRVYPRWTIDFLRRRLLNAVGSGRGRIRRLYVSRAGAGHRKVTNEPEIVALLQEHGFESVLLEKVAFRDQVSLFRDAEIVVAPHGGGLANLVFCNPGTTVVELFPATNIDLYYRLSKALGLRYVFVKSRRGPEDAMGPADYHIAPRDLFAGLEAAGATR